MKDENSEAEEGRVCSRKSQSSDLSIGSDAKQHLERVLGPQALVICVHLTSHACRHTVRMTQQRSKASPFPSGIQGENVSLNLIVTGLSSELGFRDHSTLNFLKAQSVSLFLSPPLCQAYICVQSLSFIHVIPWTVVYQTPLSMEYSSQEYWSGLPFPSP